MTVIEGGGKPPPPTPPPTPEPPDWITDERARSLWSQLLPELLRRKQYLDLFSVELGRYCVAFGEYVRTNAEVDRLGMIVKSPNNFPIQSPYLAIRNRASETMLRLAADLGLNPVAQNRLEGLQLDLFGQPAPQPTGTEGPGAGGSGFARFRH